MNSPFESRGRFRNPVVAAVETCVERRLKEGLAPGAGANGAPACLTEIDRAVAIVEAVSARIEANDFSAVESLFAGQALALDAMFNHLAKAPPYEDIRLALRAQQQCRATMKSLLALKTPRGKNVRRSAEREDGIFVKTNY